MILAHLAHLRLRNLSVNTVRERHNALLRLQRHLDLDVEDITRADLDRWQHEIVHLSPRYRSSWQSHACAFYRWAFEHDHLTTDPSRVLVSVKIPRGLPHPIGTGESLHSLRHFFGTETYRESGDLRVCQELMGHDSPTTTAVYTAFSNTAGALAVQKIADRARLLPSRYAAVLV
jgi:site-specific recombinase XerD